MGVTIKLVLVAIMAILGFVMFLVGYVIPESNYKKNPMARVKLIVRIRLGCFITMLVLLLICMFI